MFNRFILLVIVSTLPFLIQAQAQNGVLKGRVVDASTNQPLPFTNIVIWDNPQIGSTSDLDGQFTFTGLKPGFVKLAASSIGYETLITEAVMVTNAKTVFIEIPLKPSVVNLDAIVIQASPFRRVEESPVSMRALGIDEIEKNPGANRDVSKVIQSLPGVAQSVSFRNDIIVRGGGPSENRFYLDGVEIPNINHFATQGASGGPVGIINVDFIREIDLYSSAFPATRGNALSSVLSMNQIDGNRDKMNYRATVGATDLALSAEGPLGDRSSLLFSVRRSYLQFLFDLIGLPFLPTYNDLQFKYKIRLDDKNELSVIGLGALDQFKLNTGLKDPDEGQKYILGYLPVNEQYSYTFGLVYKHFFSSGFDTWVLSRNYLNNRAYKYIRNDEGLPKLFDYDSGEGEVKLRYERLRRIGSLKLSYGAGMERARYSNFTSRQLVLAGELDTLVYDSRLELYNYAAFAQLSQNYLNERLTLSFGLRTDASSYNKEMANPLQQLSPRLAAAYTLREDLFLNASLGRYFQRPAYTTMGYRDNTGRLVNKDNGLRYIDSDHFVTGIEYHPNRNSRLTVEGFLKTYQHYPFSLGDNISIASKGGDYGTFGDEEVRSVSDGRAYGMEIYYRDRDFYGNNIILSYTYVRSEFAGPDKKFIPSAWDNRHLLNVTLTRALARNWDFGFKWRYVGASPYTPYDEQLSSNRLAYDSRGMGFLDYSRFNSLRLKPFHQLDIRVDKQYFFDRWSLMVYLDIQNLYNFKAEQPPILFNLDEAGQPFIINPGDPLAEQRYQLRYIKTDSGTVLPTIGIMIEF